LEEAEAVRAEVTAVAAATAEVLPAAADSNRSETKTAKTFPTDRKTKYKRSK
jgi:hypothetical protein